MKLKNLPWVPFAFFAIAIGLYPLSYYIVDMRSGGLLHSKPKELLATSFYIPVFYIHITFGGVALLTGWSQFSKRLRDRNLRLHRLLGKIYVGSVMLSSIAGLFIAFFASGGIASVLGFGALALLWLLSVVKAYTSILKKDIRQHESWMIRNYALAFAAVTLRVYLPFSQAVLHADFLTSYRIISWLCWLPNLLIAQMIVRKRSQLPAYSPKAA
jgi:uncharacterized membrane protein